MRLRWNRRAIPRRWLRWRKCRGVLLEADLRVKPRGRLRCKLLVFRSRADLRRFWRNGLGSGGLGGDCLGAVNGLATEVQSFRKGREGERRMECDSRYFAVMGLVVGRLSMEIVTHESVHAGLCYAKRVRRDMWAGMEGFDEEKLAYPSGAIAAGVNRALWRAGLYERRGEWTPT